MWLDESQADNLLAKLQEGSLTVDGLSHDQMLMFDKFVTREAQSYLKECTPVWEIEHGVQTLEVEQLEQSVVHESKIEAPKETTVDLEELMDKETFDVEDEIDVRELAKSRRRLVGRIRGMPAIPLLRKMAADRRASTMYNIVNAVAAFVFLYRKFNADMANNSNEICKLLLRLAPCLRNDWRQLYGSATEALRSDLLTPLVGVAKHSLLTLGIMEDVEKVLSSRFLVCEQLYLIYDCFLREYEKTETSSLGSALVGKSRAQLNATLQKLILFMTFTRDADSELLTSVAAEVREARKRLSNIQAELAGCMAR